MNNRINELLEEIRALEEALAESWWIVESRAEALLPPEHFEFPKL